MPELSVDLKKWVGVKGGTCSSDAVSAETKADIAPASFEFYVGMQLNADGDGAWTYLACDCIGAHRGRSPDSTE